MAKKKETPKQIEELGEFGLINRLAENVKISHKSTIKGIGDDAAVIKNGSKLTVVTTDLLLEGIHFNLMYMPLKHLGYKAVIVNLSDVYAMNAKPEQITVSIGISSRFSMEDIEEIYDGIKLACELYNVDLVGGDTSASMTGLTLSITAIGIVDEKKVVYRSGAQENDLICVSGNLGGAFIGLQVLEREKEVFNSSSGAQPNLDGYEYVLERQLKPEARKDIIDFFAKENIQPTAMIDISDGLSSDLMHICDASNAGCKIFSDKIPVDADTGKAAEEMNLEPVTCALHGGEDYELLFTVPISCFDKLKDLQAISIIGHVTAANDGRYLILPDGSAVEIAAKGWDGLKQQE